MKLFVIVPFYNEEKLLAGCIESLSQQTDTDFTIVLVNNASTDGSLKEIPKGIIVINEPQKGTGYASDTGFCYAIDRGATYVARIDADCTADKNWTSRIKQHHAEGYLFIGGKIIGQSRGVVQKWLYAFCVRFLEIWVATVYQVPPICGMNMSIDADTYLKVGGFTRSSIEEIHEDVDLRDRVYNYLTKDKSKHFADMRVMASDRRIRKYGILGTIFWYWNYKYRPSEIDIR
jgi:glycosyltransferase involved in cell wall biosynthesis